MKDINKRIMLPDESFKTLARKHLDSLVKPRGSLGRLEEISEKIVTITRTEAPDVSKKAIFVFAGDHGITQEGVSAYPKEVTVQMVNNFLDGGAAINVLADHARCEVVIVDVGVDYDLQERNGLLNKKIIRGTKNFAREPAMTKTDAIKCINVGIGLARAYSAMGYNLLGTGDMGIGNTTPSSAIASVLTGKAIKQVTGRGTGIGNNSLKKKRLVIENAISLNKPDPKDPIDVLAKIGGAEIGAIAGLIMGAAQQRIPVVIDGMISTAGALLAYSLNSRVKGYIFASHKSVEPGHAVMLEKIGLHPLLDLGMRLGEGTGAALAMMIIEASVKIYNEMATFEQAGVSKKIVKK